MEKIKLTPEELKRNLCQFTGTDGYHKFSPLSRLVITDGVKYLADKCGAFWLLDIIASVKSTEEFQVCKLVKNKTGNGAKFVIEDGNSNIVYTQKIPFTDFPLDEIEIWNTNGVILLPSEN